VRRVLLITLAAWSWQVWAAPAPAWRLTRDAHFEVYAQTSDQNARAILDWFEKLRAFFEQPGWTPGAAPPASTVRVIVFASDQEYQPYRIRAAADAYYIGSGDQNYIVMSGSDAKSSGIAAHEYAHLVLRTSGSKLPAWLKEGLGEVYSTLHLGSRDAELGGPLRGRLQTLRGHDWLPLADLNAVSDDVIQHQERAANDLFYAESWALTGMLALSPGYAAKFPLFITAAGEGMPTLDLLGETYGKSAADVMRDLRAWVGQGAPATVPLPRVVAEEFAVEVSAVSPLAARMLIARLLLVGGELERAGELFAELDREEPGSAEVTAALGAIALRKGDLVGARLAWKRAIDEGIADAKLCYEYASLADHAGLGLDDIRPALERAVTLDSGFDDARYQLALIEKNAGHYDEAVRQFRSMREVKDSRAYPYWMALADALNELGRRDEAESAAQQAAVHAITTSERSRAAEQRYIAQTDIGVRFARDPSGRAIMITARMPHNTTDWNPFIEPGDDMRKLQGMLREIACGETTKVRVEASGKTFTLVIPDLKHVEMRHAPAEFTCGPQEGTRVTVDYALTQSAGTEGIVRRMTFE
jgi:tetratricopeptide (TPR) repeat protein